MGRDLVFLHPPLRAATKVVDQIYKAESARFATASSHAVLGYAASFYHQV